MKFVVPVWKRTNPILGESEVTVLWEVPDSVEPGLYRLGHRGFWHTIIRGNLYYEGWSQPFTVTNPDRNPDRTPEASLDEVDKALQSHPPTMSSSANSLQSPLSLFSQWF